MKFFRFLLAVMFLAVLIYTIIVGNNYGWDLFSIFFSNIVKMDWSGQFNFDFALLLFLSGLWVSWRNKFSLKGIILGLFAFIGGILFTSVYLFILSFNCNNSVKELLIGTERYTGTFMLKKSRFQ